MLSQWLAGAAGAVGQIAPEPSAYPGPAAAAPPKKKRSHAWAWIAMLLAVLALLTAGYAAGVLTRPEWIANIFHPEPEATTVQVTTNVTETSPPVTETVTTQPTPTSTSTPTTTTTRTSRSQETTTTTRTSRSDETTASSEPPTG